MVDFLLAVPDPGAWHEENLNLNPSHYTSWAGRTLLGGRGLAWVAESVGTGLHFNTGLPWPGGEGGKGPKGRTFKYGVVGLESLARDLLAWDRLYAAGRLQKPTLRLGGGAGGEEDVRVAFPGLPPTTLAAALCSNHAAAAAAALLSLPPTFTAPSFAAAVVGLSYGGDVRSLFRVEDVAKVARIAAGSGERLGALYAPHLAGPVGAAAGLLPLPSLGSGAWAQDPRPSARADLAVWLPPSLARRVAAAGGAPDAPSAVAHAAAGGGSVPSLIRRALASTVRASSARAAVAGLVATGPVVAARYVLAKAARAARAGAVKRNERERG
jgi:translocator assembly and maintenance protein 41